ncbi:MULTISPECIES: hypothetical protein, partial [unclassified Methylobacterium]|uniref:hypothetical protein n=1 Tax=unclassified Methylobacterium TaxID=2615210 RepID=UPI002269E4C8
EGRPKKQTALLPTQLTHIDCCPRFPKAAIHRPSGDFGLRWIAEIGMFHVGTVVLSFFYGISGADS